MTIEWVLNMNAGESQTIVTSACCPSIHSLQQRQCGASELQLETHFWKCAIISSLLEVASELAILTLWFEREE